MALFKKAAVFGDIHFGLKGGSRTHNQDCEDFVIWFCDTAKAEGCETCIFLGDWHNNRSTTDVSTMNYTVSNLERLSHNFEKVYLIMGNHDEYYKDKREIHSLEFARLLPNVEVINEMKSEDDVTFIPWLVADEWKTVPKIKSKYIFAHLELPSFYLNAMVLMPDHGLLQAKDFTNQDYVFSGHFHKRQHGKNITYIGNPFPHNYADAGDDDRGMMILNWGKDPEFHTWPGQPVYRVFKLSEVIDKADDILKPKMHCRVLLDLPISFEEANFIKEQFIPTYGLREMMLVPEQINLNSSEEVTNLEFESVDTIVISQLSNIDSEAYSPSMLLEIYNNL